MDHTHRPTREMRTDRTLTLLVEGMSCEHCASSVTEALESVEGVAAANVDLEAAEAELTLNADISRERLAIAVEEAGYDVPAEA